MFSLTPKINQFDWSEHFVSHHQNVEMANTTQG